MSDWAGPGRMVRVPGPVLLRRELDAGRCNEALAFGARESACTLQARGEQRLVVARPGRASARAVQD